MTTRMLVLAAASLAVLTAGCNIFGHDPDYYPMSIGSRWEYSVTETFKLHIPDTTIIRVGSWSNEAAFTDTLASGDPVTAFVSEQTMPGYSQEDTSYYRKTESAVLVYYSKTQSVPPDTFVVLPIEKGRSWTSGDLPAQVVEQEDVTVAAGTYDSCWRIELAVSSGGYSMAVAFWLADGIGMVKMHVCIEEPEGTQETVWELTAADIK